MYFLCAIGLGFIGALPILLCPAYYDNWKTVSPAAKRSATLLILLLAEIGYTLLGWWILYAGLPSIAWPLATTFSLLLFLWWFISVIITFIRNEGQSWSHAVWPPLVYIVILFIIAVSGSGMFCASEYSKLIGEINNKTQKHWSQEIAPLDRKQIRLVPQELAISLAKTTLSQDGTTLGSQFPLDESHITLQKIKNDYWYLIPLDYKSWKVWTNADCVPGYVKILATDPYAKPNLITGKKIKYTPDAFYGDNLDRRLYSKYINKVLMDYSFEEDENGNVYWVITVCRPTISFWGLVVEGVILYNPETGEDQFIAKSEIKKGSKYFWIDRVIPMDLIKDNINSWGNYKDGWWNSAWNHVNLLKAETPTLNYSADGTCVIVTPITSTNDADGAMTGLMYTNAQSGESTYYAVSGGSSEQIVIDAVNSAVSYKNWHATSQIVYENVYGKLSALIPILGSNGNYQGLAIVENENKRVAIGVTPQDALIEFQKLLMNAGGAITTEVNKDVKEYSGKITRLGWETSGSNSGKQYYIYFGAFKNSFMVSSSLQSELALTREGDNVRIKYIVSDQTVVPVTYFKNETLNLQSSKNEQAVQSRMVEQKDVNQVKADVKDFREEVKGMSDEELKKMMERKK